MNLKNKAVLITGSSSGIGEQAAYAFAREGAKVIVTYYKHEKDAKQIAEKCREIGSPDTLVIYLDVTDDASIRNAVKLAAKKFGKIDVLVNNAGVLAWKPLKEQTFSDIERQIRTNLEGLIKMTAEAFPHTNMIINIASGAGKTAYDELSTYCATKFAVRGFSQSLAKEGAKVYVVNPGMTATRMTDFRGVPPEKVADVIVSTAKEKYKVKSGGDVDVWDVI